MKGAHKMKSFSPSAVRTVLLAALIAPLALTGCATGNRAVPGNHIKGSIAGQPFEIQNPKNTLMEGVSLTHQSGTNSFTLRIDKLSSTNDPQVIDKAYAGQAAVTKTLFDGVNGTLEKLEKLAATGGKKAATGGVAP
jgi:hypothetical protein